MFNLIFGLFLLFFSLSVVIFLVLWSRKTIDFIQKQDPLSAREILKKINENKSHSVSFFTPFE